MGPPDGRTYCCCTDSPAIEQLDERRNAAGGGRLRAVAVDQRGYSPGARPEAVEEYAMPALVADAAAIIANSVER